jgi:YHS domain-containing protein
MDAKRKHLVTVSLITGLLLVVAISVNGCKKSEPEPAAPAAPAAPTVSKDMEHQMPEMAKAAEEKTGQMVEEATQAVEKIEQTTCPVMDGNAIDKNVFVEYKGKKVYFCCPDCKAKFEADPEKYIAKLPQFKQ